MNGINMKATTNCSDHKEVFSERLKKLIGKVYGEKRGSKKQFYEDFSTVLENNNTNDNKKDIYESGKKWITGRGIPKIATLELLARFFHVSIDYLIGNADSPEDYTEQHIHNYTGLSYNAIARLHEWKKESDEKDGNFFHMQAMSSLEALNIILEDNYNEEMTEGLKRDVLHYIANYLVADEMVREQGKLYFDSGSEKNLELNEGDIVIKSNTSKPLVVDHFRVIEHITNDNKKIGLHKDGNFNKRVVASIAEIYRSNSIICIEKLLSSIVKRRKK